MSTSLKTLLYSLYFAHSTGNQAFRQIRWYSLRKQLKNDEKYRDIVLYEKEY